MAAPAWSDVVQSGSASLVTPIVISMPTNLATGDRVVIFITMGRNRTQGLNWNTGTTGFVSALGGTTFNTAGNDHEHDVGYADIAGSPPSTISITPNVTKAWLAWAGRIPAGTFDPATAPEFTTTANSADPANLDPSWTEDTLFIAGISADELTFITFPLADDQDSDETGLVAGAVCSIGQTGGAARNVAAWATTEANLKGVATVCIRASAAGVGGTATPAAISVVAALPAPVPSTAAGPAAIAVPAAIPAATPSAGVTPSPATIATAAALPSPTESTGAGPLAIATVASLPAPTVDAGGGATATPAVIPVVAGLPAPAVGSGAGPAAIAGVATTLTPAVGSGASPPVVAAAATLPRPAAGSGAGPATIARAFALPAAAPAVTAGPAVIAAAAQVPRPAVGSGASPAATVTAAALPAPTVDTSGSALATPATIQVVAELPRPSVEGDEAEVAPGQILISASRLARR